jgi:hypothetical protein
MRFYCWVAGVGWFGACVLLAFEPPAGTVTPAAGAGGESWTAGAVAVALVFVVPAAAALVCGAGIRAGGFGMVSGPVWPQADSAIRVARLVRSANGDFTIRITV